MVPDRIGLPVFSLPRFAEPDYEIPFLFVPGEGFPMGSMVCCGPANPNFWLLLVSGP